MEITQVSALLRDAVGVTLKLGGPILILCMAVGVIMALLQAVTQIHEQSIGFILKMTVVITILLIGGGWMMETLKEYTIGIFGLIAS